MQLFLSGSHTLTDYDKQEIESYLEKFVPVNHIHLLCYKSIENEVLQFFLKKEQLAPRLSIYTFAPKECLPEPFLSAIDYLERLGSSYQSFGYFNTIIAKPTYEKFLAQIISKMDLVCCFYNGDKPTDVIPVDVAKTCDVQSMIYDLPKTKKHLLHRTSSDKIKLVN
ncbi:hypothetical protein [Listeria seeligeri]|uniref:Flagellar motor switch protein FliG n=1 Tax=Listeria seeligeri TaxID=1640 RepID=A0ABR5E516_LISSE|nr:hypothetical protein [Listeria seeligeri]KKD44792.1 hypothetical protein UQ68_10840 [Listeria seeligeri]MBC1722855.1 hypothetical protein [Listeria seeligeri]MBC6132552.1 hypothetical protein [Listeria seeligeri]MBF2436715.1 hypothetical protein [Listeria seeligeri]MBF2460123.1 hypothetical protein [Listeria seeligeri]